MFSEEVNKPTVQGAYNGGCCPSNEPNIGWILKKLEKKIVS
jgi:hypothetical protein